jgi:chitinase
VAGKKLTSQITVKKPVKLSSTSFTLEKGHYKTLKVSGTTSKVTWSSSNTSVATVSSGGKVTAKAAGSATIYAKVAGKKLSSKVKVIKLSSSSFTLEKGQTKTLKVAGTTSKVAWSSGKTSIATVSSSGKVTAKAVGSTTIYAKVDGKTLTGTVTVKQPVVLSSSSFTLEKGQTKTLKVTGTSSKVTWSSGKTSVATVSSSGKVTAKAVGTATISAKVDGKTLTATVKVKAPAPTKAPTVTPTPTPVNPPKVETENSAKVVGYYAAWSRYQGFTPDRIDGSRLTHINYSFANIGPDLKITLGYPDIDPLNIRQLNELKIKYPHLKTLIAIGGWTWSGRFSDVALTELSRNTFADSVVDFIVLHGFDGVDIDWEYPVSGGLADNIRRPEDKQNFTLLMKTLREKLDVRGAKEGKHYILSFAGAAGSWYLKNVELQQLSQYVDYANLMTYDIHGTWDTTTDFNAPLYIDSQSYLPQYRTSVDSSVRDWLGAGFPRNKLVMGVPFYGILYQMPSTVGNGLYQPFSGGATVSYDVIASYYLNSTGFMRYFHPEARVPWLFNGTTFISYDDEESLREKAEYINTMNLAGAMIWELSQDPAYVLLKALHAGLKK